jgi:hypothetical protein
MAGSVVSFSRETHGGRKELQPSQDRVWFDTGDVLFF